MSGKRHHFIPQFIQEGFASQIKGNNVFTWVYRKDARPFNSNVINVGVEHNFYSDESGTEADDLITPAESAFCDLIRKLRAGSPGRVSDPAIAALIAHLEVRTRHLRQSMLLAGDYLISRLIDFVSDQDAFAIFLQRSIRNNPTLLRNAFATELERLGIASTMLETVLQVASPLLPSVLDQMKPLFPHLAEQLRIILPEYIQKGAKAGHIGGLKKAIVPAARRERYETLSYTVAEIPEEI
jgi:hypothetical protein